MTYHTRGSHLRSQCTRVKQAIATYPKLKTRLSTHGFTLLELMVIVLIISLLFAIMAPGWVEFMNVQRLNAGQERVYQAMRDAQSRAKRTRMAWQASFQESNGVVQWAVHSVNSTPTASAWSSLDAAIRIDAETTLQQSGGMRRVQFDHEGHISGQLGRLTLSGKNGGKAKRCVVVSTLLGVIRTGSEHATMQDGKYCY